MAAPVRPKIQRQIDALARIAAENHLWIATASPELPLPYLIPISYAWTDGRLIVATSTKSPTARNLFASERARLAIGATDDVVLIDALLDTAVPVKTAPPEIADVYASQSDWDPRTGTELPSHYFVLAPQSMQVWREANELPGRTIMSEGRWLLDD